MTRAAVRADVAAAALLALASDVGTDDQRGLLDDVTRSGPFVDVIFRF